MEYTDNIKKDDRVPFDTRGIAYYSVAHRVDIRTAGNKGFFCRTYKRPVDNVYFSSDKRCALLAYIVFLAEAADNSNKKLAFYLLQRAVFKVHFLFMRFRCACAFC